MKKNLLLVLVLLSCAVGVRAQLLWKISGKGLEKPSYVVGTYHLAPATFADSIAGLKSALDASEQVYGELNMDVMANPAEMMKLQQAMLLPQGTKLSSLLDADQRKRLNAYLTSVLGADLDNPMAGPQLEMLTPAALSMQLTVLTTMKKIKNFDANNLFDAYFQKEAKEKGKPVGGLETVEFQAKVLYGGKSLERQVVSLMCMIDHEDYYDTMGEELLSAFYAQDLKRIVELTEEKLNNACDATPEEEDALIYSRNAAWAHALPAIFKDRSTFLAVGAAHLPGDRGLLALLREAGYTVEPVK